MAWTALFRFVRAPLLRRWGRRLRLLRSLSSICAGWGSGERPVSYRTESGPTIGLAATTAQQSAYAVVSGTKSNVAPIIVKLGETLAQVTHRFLRRRRRSMLSSIC